MVTDSDRPKVTFRSKQGFSLLELLVVICILGLMASVAVPAFSFKDSAQENRFRRNAQELASMCAVAAAAGLDFVVESDLDATIRNIVKGGEPTSGVFTGRTFGLKHIGEEDIEGVKKYLSIEKGNLVYQRPES